MKLKSQFFHSLVFMLLLSGTFFVCTATVRASAFMLSEGQHMYTTGFTYSTANEWFDQNRNRVAQGCTSSDYSWNHSYTYGYSYYNNFFANTSLVHQSCGAGKVTGLGDAQLGVRGRLDNTRNGRTWEIALNIPTGYDNQKINRLGYGRFGVWAGLAWSTQNTGWEEKMPSYWEFGTGMNYWFGAPSSQSRSYVKWSWRLDENGDNRIVLQGTLKLSLRDGRAEFPVAFAGFPRYSGDYDAGVLAAKYSRRLTEQWTVSVGAGNTVWGRKTSASWYGNLSFTYRWDS